jgi:hypothetical protein
MRSGRLPGETMAFDAAEGWGRRVHANPRAGCWNRYRQAKPVRAVTNADIVPAPPRARVERCERGVQTRGGLTGPGAALHYANCPAAVVPAPGHVGRRSPPPRDDPCQAVAR